MRGADGLTEEGWLRAQNPGLMLKFVRPSAGARRIRLATVGVCRAAWPFLPSSQPHPREAECLALLDLSERFADGAAKFSELMAARRALAGSDVPRGGPADRKIAAAWFASAKDPAKGCTEAAFHLLGISWGGADELNMPATRVKYGYSDSTGDWPAACLSMVAVIRDVFGNPFRKVEFDPAWRTDTVVSLAKQMYETRDFGAMPILADALQDVGYDNEDVLNHCRDTSVAHVRGCWVVDLMLGKT